MDAIEDAVTLRDLFNGLVLPGGGIRFRGDYFRTLIGPGVYMFLLDHRPLYIGLSEFGLARVTGPHHQDRARQECDEVLFWPARSIDAARALEALLIRRLYPKYNSRYSGELYR